MKPFLFIVVCLFIIQSPIAQVPFALEYYETNSSGPNLSDLDVAANGDILMTNGTVSTGTSRILRANSSGTPLWTTSIQFSSSTGLVAELPSGALMVPASMPDSISSNQAPAFHLLDANGNWLSSRYYSLGSLNVGFYNSVETTFNDCVTLFAANGLYGAISVNGSGTLNYCKTYPEMFFGQVYAKMVSANSGGTLMFYEGFNDLLKARRITAAGNVNWEKSYAVNGSMMAEFLDATQLTHALYAVAMRIPGSPNAVGVMFINNLGDVQGAYAYEHVSHILGGAKLRRLSDDKVLLEISSNNNSATAVRIKSNGQLLGSVPTSDRLYLLNARGVDSTHAYRIYPNDLLVYHDLTATASLCESVDMLMSLPISVSATSGTSIANTHPVSLVTPTINASSRTVLGNPDCVSTAIDKESGDNETYPVYPNPVQGARLSVPMNLAGAAFHIYSAAGRLLSNGLVSANGTINVDALKKGVYLLQIDESFSKRSLRFVKA